MTVQVDSVLGEVRQLIALAKEAAARAGQAPDVTDLQQVLDNVTEIRENQVEAMVDRIENYLSLVKVIATAVGATLLCVAAVSIVSSILLVCCSYSMFDLSKFSCQCV
jgi:hypothetical protein